MPPYTLPDLDYDFGALEPHISGTIMELHHGKHHAGYVKNANATLGRLDEARSMRSGACGTGRTSPSASRRRESWTSD
jgi:superoxide dismutase